MKVALFGSGQRARTVLKALLQVGVDVLLCVHSGSGNDEPFSEFVSTGSILGFGPRNPSGDPEFLAMLRNLSPDIIFCVAYHHLLTPDILECGKECINFHAGDLSRYRGSSPMNWALIEGEPTFTISACRMDASIDSGDIVKEKTIDISTNDTISDLHEFAMSTYAEFALEIVAEFNGESLTPIRAPSRSYRYCSRRFPDDAFVVWDAMSAWEVHNLIRASSSPFGGTISFLEGREVRLWKSVWPPESQIRTAPGRVCRITADGIYVGAQDHALLVSQISCADSGDSLLDQIKLYERFETMGNLLLQHLRRPK